MWSSIQVLPNQVSKKFFYTFEDINLRGKDLMQSYIKKPSDTPGADSV